MIFGQVIINEYHRIKRVTSQPLMISIGEGLVEGNLQHLLEKLSNHGNVLKLD